MGFDGLFEFASIVFLGATIGLLSLQDRKQCNHQNLFPSTHAATSSPTKLLPILDPLFNVRQICKNILLLEDHLSVPGMKCKQCIMKHFLYLEGYAEEAITLDTEGKYKDMLAPIPQILRGIQSAYVNGSDTLELSQKLRELRKKLTPLVFEVGLNQA